MAIKVARGRAKCALKKLYAFMLEWGVHGHFDKLSVERQIEEVRVARD